MNKWHNNNKHSKVQKLEIQRNDDDVVDADFEEVDDEKDKSEKK